MMRVPPPVGVLAPDFAAATREGGETIRLSTYRGERPVVLIFGSWT
jgi:peroxiredoxin